jgi:LPS sulfotransferase NodH
MTTERFVVLTLPRTGSHYLCGLLDSHPHVLCHQEIFNPDHVWFSMRYKGRHDPALTDIAARDRDRLGFLRRVWADREGRSCVGFKLFHFDHPLLLDAVIRDRSIAIILLYRQNLLRTWTSWEIACRTDIWNSIDREKLGNREPVRLDFDLESFVAYVQKSRALRTVMSQRLEAADRMALEVSYESLTAGTAMASVTAFLGLDPGAALRSPFLRIGGPRLADSYRDFAAVERALAGSSMAWMLADERLDG